MDLLDDEMRIGDYIDKFTQSGRQSDETLASIVKWTDAISWRCAHVSDERAWWGEQFTKIRTLKYMAAAEYCDCWAEHGFCWELARKIMENLGSYIEPPLTKRAALE
jgi:hypothetical protein